jgi:hypothetical protein
MKNKAAAMGGDVVVPMTNRAGYTAGESGASETNVTLSGNVYKCPEG